MSTEHLTVRMLVESLEPRVTPVGGTSGLARAVESVSDYETDDSLRWMAPHSLVISSGMTLRDATPERFAGFIEGLDESGMSAFGLAMTPYWTEVPAAMVAAADRLSFPVLRISGGISFHQIVGHVFGALASHRLVALQRSLSAQESLIELVAKGHGPEHVVRTLSRLLNADVALFDCNGHIVAHSDRASPLRRRSAVWPEVWSLHTPGHERMCFGSEYETYFREICVADDLEAVLAAVLPKAQSLGQFGEHLLSFARSLLASTALANRNAPVEECRAREALLTELLHGHGHDIDQSERLARRGIIAAEPMRLLAIAPNRSESGTRRGRPKETKLLSESGVDVANSYLLGVGVRFLSVWYHDCLVVALSLANRGLSVDVRRFVQELVEHIARTLHLERLSAGLSEPFTGTVSVPEAFIHASQALMSITYTNKVSFHVVLYEDLGLPFAVLNSLSEEHLQRLRARIIEPLLENDQSKHTQLYETLLAYLTHSRSLIETAQVLYLHRNTLSRRLEAIQKVLRINLNDTNDLVEVYLATRAADLLELRKGLR